MFESILETLAVRQMTALEKIPEVLSKLPELLFTGKIKSFFTAFIAVFQLMGVIISDTPAPVIGDPIDLTGYSLVFSDEFKGDSLDTEVWQEVSPLGTGEINDISMVSFDGDNLIISTQYLENGSKGPGWYTYGMENTDAYSNFQPGSYFECRCKIPAAKGMWSAFWLMTSGNKTFRTGPRRDYTEIDVMESPYYKRYSNTTLTAVHKYRVEQDNFKSEIVGKYRVGGKDIYNEYTTYGVLWTEEGFIFYIDGKESGRSTNGITTDPAFMLLTCQVRVNGEDNPEVLDNPDSAFPAKFIVDYVRVYSKNIDT